MLLSTECSLVYGFQVLLFNHSHPLFKIIFGKVGEREKRKMVILGCNLKRKGQKMSKTKEKNPYFRKSIILELEILLNEAVLTRTLKKLRERGNERKCLKILKYLSRMTEVSSLSSQKITQLE